MKELCSISTGKSNTQDKIDDGEYPFYVRSPIVEHSNKYLFDEEAVLTVGDGVGTGKVFHYVNGKYDLHQRCYRMFAFKEDLRAKYFYYIFSKLFYKRVMAMTAKTSVDSVRLEMISEMSIPVPSVAEQLKIESLLSELDNFITLQQRKLNSHQKLKKGLFQKMFPKNGENIPEIRFPEFSDAWKQRKLSESAKFSKGNGYSKSDVTTKGIPLVLYGRLYTNYETVISNIDTYSELENEGSVVSKGGEIIVPASGETAEDISRASVIKDSGVLIGGDLNIICPSNDIIPSFLALTITYGNVHKEMTKLAQGKTVVHLHNSDLYKIRFFVPSYNEQLRITALFSNIESTITLQQRWLFYTHKQS